MSIQSRSTLVVENLSKHNAVARFSKPVPHFARLGKPSYKITELLLDESFNMPVASSRFCVTMSTRRLD